MIVGVAELRIYPESVGSSFNAVQFISLSHQSFKRGRQIGAAAVVVSSHGVIVVCEGVIASGHLVDVTHTV